MGQSRPPLQSPFPLPVATLQSARSLIRMHQYLRGELLKQEGSGDVLVEPAECHEAMAHIEGLLRFMRVNFDPKVLKARRAFPKIGRLEYGQVRAGALACLKRARDWLLAPM